MAESASMSYFPLFINMRHKKFLVFGAGRIAYRRISGLLRYGAAVVVVAPHMHEQMCRLQSQYPGQLQLEQRAYSPGEIREGQADYVLAATDQEAVNTSVAKECRSKQIPVNHAGDHRQCDFYFPALVEQSDLVIGLVSTDGNHKKTAAAGAMLRSQLSENKFMQEQ